MVSSPSSRNKTFLKKTGAGSELLARHYANQHRPDRYDPSAENQVQNKEERFLARRPVIVNPVISEGVYHSADEFEFSDRVSALVGLLWVLVESSHGMAGFLDDLRARDCSESRSNEVSSLENAVSSLGTLGERLAGEHVLRRTASLAVEEDIAAGGESSRASSTDTGESNSTKSRNTAEDNTTGATGGNRSGDDLESKNVAKNGSRESLREEVFRNEMARLVTHVENKVPSVLGVFLFPEYVANVQLRSSGPISGRQAQDSVSDVSSNAGTTKALDSSGSPNKSEHDSKPASSEHSTSASTSARRRAAHDFGTEMARNWISLRYFYLSWFAPRQLDLRKRVLQSWKRDSSGSIGSEGRGSKPFAPAFLVDSTEARLTGLGAEGDDGDRDADRDDGNHGRNIFVRTWGSFRDWLTGGNQAQSGQQSEQQSED